METVAKENMKRFLAMGRSKLLALLRDPQARARHPTIQPNVLLVVGNESCDLDSAACAISYSFYLSQLHSSRGKSDKSLIIAPVLNTLRNSFHCFTEVVFSLSRILFSQQNCLNELKELLLFRDQIDFVRLKQSADVWITLVDHNQLSNQLSPVLDECVREVVDHHEVREPLRPSINQIISKVGSCSTLIAEKMLNDSEVFPSSSAAEPALMLLYSALITDTDWMQNFKTTTKDRTIGARLSEVLKIDEQQSLRWLARIYAAKKDVSGLSALEVLAKDYKGLSSSCRFSIGMSSVPITLSEFLQKAGSDDASLLRFLSKQTVEVLVVLTLPDSLDERRKLVVCSPNPELVTALKSFLVDKADLCCDISAKGSISRKHFPNCAFCSVLSAGTTRKQILPVLEKEFMK